MVSVIVTTGDLKKLKIPKDSILEYVISITKRKVAKGIIPFRHLSQGKFSVIFERKSNENNDLESCEGCTEFKQLR